MQLKSFQRFVRYYLQAQTVYRIHSPYLYHLIDFVCDAERLYYDFQLLEQINVQLQRYRSQVSDKASNKNHQSTGPQYSKTAQSTFERIYRLVLLLQPQEVIEINSMTPIISAAVTIAAKNAHVTSVIHPSLDLGTFRHFLSKELDNQINFNSHAQGQIGSVAQSLTVIHLGHSVDELAQIHKTVIRSRSHTIILFGHHNSDQTEKYWSEWKQINKYNIKIDFFDFAVLLHRPKTETQIDFTYIEYYKKWWQMGFF